MSFSRTALHKTGFSLIELSIVLVIIGLIVAGVVGGKSLTRQAELRRVLTEADGYKTIYNAFRMQFDSMPGDFKEASTYWSGAHDGDGDRAIHDGTEYLYVWEHLALAELIPGSYTGLPSSGKAVIGVNIPPSKMRGASYIFETPNPSQTPPSVLIYGRGGAGTAMLQFGGQNNSMWPEEGMITAAEARTIDKKIDDGRPDKGNLFTRRAWTYDGSAEVSGCVSATHTDTSGAVTYTLTDINKSCMLDFWMQ
jgi:prepilin-type N-terminal cleavage/methylation domain-containing protein